MSLHPCISMRQTPNSSGPYQIIEVDPSGEWQRQINLGRRDDLRFMGSTGRSYNWRQNWRRWRVFLQVWGNGSAPGLVGNYQKYKHGKHCNNQQNVFFKFFLSVGGMLGREALVLLAQLSQTMAEKRDKTFLHVQGWINGRIKITVAGYYSRMIRRAQLPGPLQDREPYWYP